jgi:hypothetical protein
MPDAALPGLSARSLVPGDAAFIGCHQLGGPLAVNGHDELFDVQFVILREEPDTASLLEKRGERIEAEQRPARVLPDVWRLREVMRDDVGVPAMPLQCG